MRLKDVGKIVKWKLLKKLKLQPEPKETTKPETDQESETILAEYHETLRSGESTTRREPSHFGNKMSSEQRVYRDVDAIEGNIDGLRKGKAKTASSDLGRKVDRLLARKQKK
ncbi:MAG: hypothetical protein U9R21_02115 [Candidatus Thermoplasmatota archaeon]|nr:hypothetical protein [Candidatus Thermoplasmatota archaeon]